MRQDKSSVPRQVGRDTDGHFGQLAVLILGCTVCACDGNPQDEARVRPHGQALYEVSCAACHEKDGQGKTGVASPLAGSEWVTGPAGRLTRIALHGVRGEITVRGSRYNLEMPAFAHIFNDTDLAAILSYVRAAWGNKAPEVTATSIGTLRRRFGQRDSWTEEELLETE